MRGKSLLGLILLLALAVAVTAADANTNCSTDNDCGVNFECRVGKCSHKGMFPLRYTDILATILFILISSMTNIAGIGGGAIYSPLVIMILDYEVTKAIYIAYVVTFGGVLSNFFINVRMRQSESRLPYINYTIAALSLPLLLSGTVVGTILNKVAPDLVILVTLVVLLVVVMKKSVVKAKQLYKQEQQNKEIETESQATNVRNDNASSKSKPVSEEEVGGLAVEGAREGLPEVRRIEEIQVVGKENENLALRAEGEATKDKALYAQIDAQEKKILPMNRVAAVVIFTCIILLLNLIKGSSKFKSILGVQICSPVYFICDTISFFLSIALFFTMKHIIRRFAAQKTAVGYSSPFKFQLTDSKVNQLAIVGFIAGVLVGFAGIGGGLVMSPLLLEIGLPPEFASKTSGFTVIFTSFLSVMIAFLSGGLEGLAIAWFLPIVGFGVYLFAGILNHLIFKYNRKSYILFALTFVVIIAIIIIPLYTILQFARGPASKLWATKSLCS
eukprot:TRINITY_DN9643_c0_g1_i3.p1 TRINITY_DN9643_c0_g1~~TRINITY_DN9643_c0_g1_i3.p1  ORF type:complete len:502 (-),score=100.20 TRINITY_DN9643_c0_g1_i3:43-1548(-)